MFLLVESPTSRNNQVGLSENNVASDPLVNHHYHYLMTIIGGVHHFQTNPGEPFEPQHFVRPEQSPL